MPRRSTEIGRIISYGDVDLARARLSRTLRQTRGNVEAAARVLGTNYVTVWRWIYRLALEDFLAKVREERRASGARTHRTWAPGERYRNAPRGSASTRVDAGRSA